MDIAFLSSFLARFMPFKIALFLGLWLNKLLFQCQFHVGVWTRHPPDEGVSDVFFQLFPTVGRGVPSGNVNHCTHGNVNHCTNGNVNHCNDLLIFNVAFEPSCGWARSLSMLVSTTITAASRGWIPNCWEVVRLSFWYVMFMMQRSLTSVRIW